LKRIGKSTREKVGGGGDKNIHPLRTERPTSATNVVFRMAVYLRGWYLFNRIKLFRKKKIPPTHSKLVPNQWLFIWTKTNSFFLLSDGFIGESEWRVPWANPLTSLKVIHFTWLPISRPKLTVKWELSFTPESHLEYYFIIFFHHHLWKSVCWIESWQCIALWNATKDTDSRRHTWEDNEQKKINSNSSRWNPFYLLHGHVIIVIQDHVNLFFEMQVFKSSVVVANHKRANPGSAA